VCPVISFLTCWFPGSDIRILLCFSGLVGYGLIGMVTSRWFFVKSNSFDFVCEEGVLIFRMYEKCRGLFIKEKIKKVKAAVSVQE
jgi:hypothetical protein